MKRILRKYIDRLNDSIQRSALLRSYPVSKVSSRIDLNRLAAMEENLPTELLEGLIYNNNSSFPLKFQYDDLPRIHEQIKDLKEKEEKIPCDSDITDTK